VRGIAALIVVVYHVSLIAQPFAESGTAQTLWEIGTQSPLKLGFAGTEAVQLFFVLSGLVVTLPALREGFFWPGYYVSRLVRLYLPVWGAILLSLLLVVVLPRDPGMVREDEWIVNTNITEPDWVLALSEATLTPASYDVVNTLWSLRWELLFSILLPVYVALAILVRRWALPAGVLCIAVIVGARLLDGGPFDLRAVVYLPAFLLGSLIAVRLDDIIAWSRRRSRPALWAVLFVVSSLVLIAGWWTRSFIDQGSTLGRALSALAAAGAAGLILVVICSPLAERIMQSAPMRWLGKVSFSLYLVHVPVLATLAFSWGDENWPLVLLAGMPLSVLVAWAFYAVVERPAHLLARASARGTRHLFSSRYAEAEARAASPSGEHGAAPEPTAR
jgi:peptidoglycan/LPS O-acetylase OafA/YrhL